MQLKDLLIITLQTNASNIIITLQTNASNNFRPFRELLFLEAIWDCRPCVQTPTGTRRCRLVLRAAPCHGLTIPSRLLRCLSFGRSLKVLPTNLKKKSQHNPRGNTIPEGNNPRGSTVLRGLDVVKVPSLARLWLMRCLSVGI